MNRMAAVLLCAGLLLLGRPDGRASAQAAPPATAAAAQSERQLLVMLPLPRAHYRPDSSYAGAYGDGMGQTARQRSAAALARKHGLTLHGDWPMPLVGVDCYVMGLADGDARSAAALAEVLAREAGVAWAQPMQTYRAQSGTGPDPLYASQPAARQWRLAELHGLATGRGVRVAVIDSGIEPSHPELAGQLASNQNFVDGRPLTGESHGTAVAGIIAARAGNGVGIAGVAPRSRLLGLRACWQVDAVDTLCNSLSLAKALHAALQQDAQIINMSLGGPTDRLLGVLLDQALARGVAVVAPLGAAPAQGFPASHPGVLAVGAAPPVPAGSLLAPGQDVPSTAPAGGFALVSGSSFAAAHVAGLLALLRELDGDRGGLLTEAGGRIDAWASLTRRRPQPANLGHASQ